MEHYKECCETCVFEEKCSPYEKRCEVSCLFFVDNDFSEINNCPEILYNLLENELGFRWSEMSWNRAIYGVRHNSTGHVSEEMNKEKVC